jgi:hypothetical protein
VTIASTEYLTGSLATVMSRLVELEKQVHDELRVYRWPPRVPDLPCIWNTMPSAPFEQRDTGRFRDNLNISVRVGIRHTDVDEQMAKLEEYADAFRFVIDPALWTHNPLGAKWAIRQDMRIIPVTFGADPEVLHVIALEFPIQVQLDRMIPAI